MNRTKLVDFGAESISSINVWQTKRAKGIEYNGYFDAFLGTYQRLLNLPSGFVVAKNIGFDEDI